MNKKKSFLFLAIIVAFAASLCDAKQVSKRKKVRFGKKSTRVVKHVPNSLSTFRKTHTKKVIPVPVAPVVPVKKEQKIVKKAPERKKRIVIFSSTGGGGHTAVSKGLRGYLSKDYEITVVNVFQEVLTSIDTLGAMTFGKICSEDFYNFCLRVRWTNVAGKFVSTGANYISWRQSTLEKLFLEYFSNEKPDLIISVMPTINAALLTVSEKLALPFLVITNDLDTTNYINNINAPRYNRFRYTIAFEDDAIRDKIKAAGFSKEQVVVTGFPLRPEFFKEKDKKAIKKDFNVPEGKPVVMVFMGGAGSLSSYRYVRTLAKMDMPMHILVCLGRNEQLRRNISRILLPEDVTITIIGFTDRIADLMSISDVLITKPGPGSVCEALESNVPMILDQTTGTLWWEEMNISFMVKNGFGESLTNFNDLVTIFPKYIKDKNHTAAIKKKMKAFKRERFDLKICPLIEEMTTFNTPVNGSTECLIGA